ncbi:MAG: 3-hydroxyacyl-CoA dehydrogenase family protein [Eubacteriales bacterium]|jgi:3-hydroxybutyryl-CoA dehydrogenase
MNQKKVGIIGTGVIGAGTATLLIGNEYQAVMLGRTQASCEKGYRNVVHNLDEMIELGLLTAEQKEACLPNLILTQSYEDLADCCAVIESASEKLEDKHEVMKKLEQVLDPKAVIGSTTSAISANAIAQALQHRERFMVTHSWNPPHLVPLVEIVVASETTEESLDAMKALLEDLGRVPVVIRKDVPGFIGNRLQHALFREALHMIEEGIATAEDIDKAVLNSFGPRYSSIGLMEFYDAATLPLQYNVQSYLLPHLCNDTQPQKPLTDALARGDEGINTGKGVLDWSDKDLEDFAYRKIKPFLPYANWKVMKK